MKLSIVTSVFVNYRLMDAIEQIESLDVEGIDIWCGRPHTYRKDYSPEMLEELKKKLIESHLTPVSLMPAFAHYPYSLSSPMEYIRQDSIQYMKETIDQAAILGASYVLVVPKQSLYGQSLEDSRQCFLDSLAVTAEYAKSKGIKLALEVVYPKLSDHMGLTDDAIRMIKKLGTGNIGVALDSGHLNLSGEKLEQAIEGLGEYLFQVHANDNNQVTQQNAIPGQGNFNFKRFFDLLDKYQYKGFLSIELSWVYSFDPIPALQKSIAHLRQFLPQII